MLDNDNTPISITLIAFIMLLIYIRLNRHYSYWHRKNIPHIRPTLLVGNLRYLFLLRTSFGDFFKSIYESASNQQAPVVGMYLLHKPALLLREPELIGKIFKKNFHLFLNRYEAADCVHDSMGYLTLPLAKYPIWRETRKRMAEFFTSGQLKKRMYPLMLKVSFDLEHHIKQRFPTQENVKSTEAIIEVKELCALYTTDLTALLAYSIRAEGLNGNLTIRQALVDMLSPTFSKGFNFFVIFFLPHLTSLIRAKVFPASYIKFIRKMLETNLKQRKNAANSDIYKDDLIDLLVNFQKQSMLKQTHRFVQHPDFIASQVGIMLVAGFETSSSLIAFILYELAKQPAIQQRLRCEIKERLLEDGESIKYENLLGMTYLHMVVAEGLRMYPTASFINREFTPETDATSFSLKPFVNFELTRGVPVYVSILGLHRDEKYWPNPHKFDPERFQPECIKFIHPMTYIPFGVGPHSCIGSRLGVIQLKLGLVHILKNYTIETCDSTPEKIIFEPKSFMLQNKGGIELKFVRDCNE